LEHVLDVAPPAIYAACGAVLGVNLCGRP